MNNEPSTIYDFLCKTNPILSASGGFKMNASSAITMNYEQLTMNYANKNKPNSKPIKPKTKPKQTQYKPNSRKGIIDAKCVFTKDYEEKCG